MALSPERRDRKVMQQLQSKLIERVRDTGTHLKKSIQLDEAVSMKTSVLDNTQVGGNDSFKRKIVNIQKIEHTNAQKRIVISPKSSTNKSSNDERNKFFRPTQSALVDDLKSADYNRNNNQQHQNPLLNISGYPKEHKFQPNRDIVDMNQSIYSQQQQSDYSIQSKRSFKNGLAAYTQSKPIKSHRPSEHQSRGNLANRMAVTST